MTDNTNEKGCPFDEPNAFNPDQMEKHYEWLRTAKLGWVQGRVGLPVKVEVLSADFESRTCKIKTEYQSGEISFDRIFPMRSDCPCR